MTMGEAGRWERDKCMYCTYERIDYIYISYERKGVIKY